MKNICCLFRLLAVMAISVTASFAADVWDGSVAESFGEGKGTAAEPYKISNGAELALFAQKVSAGDTALSAVLTNDIYLNDSTESYEKWGEEAPKNHWSAPIGLYNHRFQGTFDGKGYSVYGAYLDTVVSQYYVGIGLFGTAGTSAKVTNLAVKQSYFALSGQIDAYSAHIGVLSGLSYGSEFTNVMAEGRIYSNVTSVSTAARYSEIGCLLGYATGTTYVKNAVTNCKIESAIEKGSTGTVYHSLGGFIGKLEGTTHVEAVYSLSEVSDVTKSTASGVYVGGVVGNMATATDTLYNAYYNISTIGTENAPATAIGNSKGVSSNVASKTTAKMKSEDFASLLGTAFTYTAALNDGYPQPVVFEGAAAFDGGDGSEESPYLIGSAKALRAVSGLVNGMNAEFGGKSYKMIADVELNEDAETYKSWETTPPEFSWYQIGLGYHRVGISIDCDAVSYGCGYAYFSGSFDGNGKVIKGLYVNDLSGNSQGGLFYVVKNGTVKNVSVEESFIRTKGRASGIVGIASDATLENCINSAELRSVSQDNGGIVGHANNSVITGCVNNGNLKTTTMTGVSLWSNGGIAGELFSGSTMSYCVNNGTIEGNGQNVGGLAGYITSSKITTSYNRGIVSGDSIVGGLVGSLNGSLSASYSAGAVSSTKNYARGGAVGSLAASTDTVSDVYYDTQIVGSANAPSAAIGKNSAVITNVSGLTTASMTTGRFAIMLGSAFKQNDAVNDGYPTFLAEGETYGAENLFAGGNGSAENPFLIATATQLRNMEYLVNQKNAEYGDKNYKVIADISLNENTSEYENWGTTAPANTWTPMGSSESIAFNGIFDGGNFTISGIYSNTTNSGLFGFIGENGFVKNVALKESYVKTTVTNGVVAMLAARSSGRIDSVRVESSIVNALYFSFAGGIVGLSSAGKISNSSNAANIKVAGNAKGNHVDAGGIAGKVISTDVENVVNEGSISVECSTNNNVVGIASVGGIAGVSALSNINKAVNKGSVYAWAYDNSVQARAESRVGGIVGLDSVGSSFLWCENTGSVEGIVTSLVSSDLSYTNVGGIVGDQWNTTYIRFCHNSGNLTATSSYAYNVSEIGGILGFNRGTAIVENCYSNGKFVGKATATASPKNVRVTIGGICSNLRANSVIKGAYFYGTMASTVSGTTTSNQKGGIVGGGNAGTIIGSYFDSDVAGFTNVYESLSGTGSVTKALALTTAEMQTNEFAWKLNTLGGDSTNSGAYTRYNSYPVFADDSYLPIRRVVFDDEINITNAYTSYKGYISAPADPEPAAGYQFVGWTDGDKYMLQNRQVIEKDMTLYALFTLVTEPVYFITFVDGSDIYVKATETTGKVAAFPIAKNIPMGYHFDGWYDNATNKAVDENAVFTGTATVVAKFTANLYAITFLDYDGTELQSSDVAYGSIPTAPSVIRESSEEYSYTFAGWTPTIENVSGEATYTAVYDSTKIESSSSEEISSSSAAESSSSETVESSSSEEILSSSTEESSSSAMAESSSSGSVKSSSSNASSSSVASSSSAKSSSSTAKSSSSVAKSSSSTVKSSSSEAESSSSTKTSSSSSKKDSSSSSKNEDAIMTIATVPHFNVSVAGRSLQISGVKLDSKIAVFDIRGNVMYAGFAYAENFSIDMQNSGRYLVRVGTQVQVVNIR